MAAKSASTRWLAALAAISICASGALAASAGEGERLWVAHHQSPAGRFAVPFDVAGSSDGSRLFVVGESDGAPSQTDFVTVAYAAGTGAQLWSRRLDGPGRNAERATAVAVSSDGTRVFVTGWDAQLTYTTIAYDAASGTQLWGAHYARPGSGDNTPFSVAVSPDGSQVFVTGTSGQLDEDHDIVTVAYDAATGARMWVRAHSGRANVNPIRPSIGVTPDGTRVFVAAGRTTPDDLDWSHADDVTIAYDASSGKTIWQRRYTYTIGNDKIGFDAKLVVSPDGTKVYVAGSTIGSETGNDYITLAYDAATGKTLWQRRYNGSGAGSDIARGVAVSRDGTRVVVTGESRDAAQHESTGVFATVAYDTASGARLWVRRYRGIGSSGGWAADFGPGGNRVYVTGRTSDPSGTSTVDAAATIAYDALTGHRAWSALYTSGRGSDAAYLLAVAPDGSRLYVSGPSCVRFSSECEFTTVAYGTG